MNVHLIFLSIIIEHLDKDSLNSYSTYTETEVNTTTASTTTTPSTNPALRFAVRFFLRESNDPNKILIV